MVNWRQIHSLSKAKEDDNIYVKHIYDEVDLKVNGHKALGWFPHVEYYLNLAASGKLNYDDPLLIGINITELLE